MMTSKLQFPNSRPSRILTHGSALFSSLLLMMAGGNVDAQDTVIRYNSSGTQTASGTDIYAVQTANGFASGDVIKLSGDVEFNSSQIYVGDGKNSEFLNFTIQSDTPGVKRTIKKVNSGRFYNINYNAGANASITLKDLAYDGTGNPIGNVLGIFMWYSTKNSTFDLTIDNVSFTGFENTKHNCGVLGGTNGMNMNITVTNGLVFDSNKVTGNNTYGAAIVVDNNGKLDISGDSVTFSNNFAKGYGGAIHASNTTITANSIQFTNNTAELIYGGAVNLYSGTLTLNGQGENAQINFSGNTAGQWGGAIRGNTALSNASIRFENNKAGTFGGAIHGNSVVFSGDSTTAVFTGNSAADSGNDLYITGDAGILSFSGSGTYSFDGGIVLEKETAQTAINKAQVTISGRENDDTNHYQLQNVSISNGGRLTVLLDQINTLTGLFSVGADSTLEVNVGDGAEKSFANNITGAGGLTKTGNGKLTLTGTNTYTGKTTISAGTLALSGDAYSNVYALTMDNAGRFEMKSDGTVKLSSLNGAGEVLLSASNTVLELGVGTQAGDSAVFSGHIISSANQKNLTLKKVGAGTQTLNRAGYLYAHLGNSYKEVIVDEGRLIVDAVNSVYTASRTEGFFRAPIIVNEGGTLEYVQKWTTSPNIDLTLNGGTLQLDNAQYLNKLNFNSGTVTLGSNEAPLRAGYVGTGVWNVTGGNSVIENPVEIVKNGDHTTFTLNIADGASLEMKRNLVGLSSHSGSAVNVVGTGANGTGLLKLYSGPDLPKVTALGTMTFNKADVQINGGMETWSGDGFFASDVVLTDADLNVNADAGKTVKLDRKISGNGTLTKTGAGTLLLAGEEGEISVQSLRVQAGRANADGFLTGDLAIADGAVFSPGDGIGTLTVNGIFSAEDDARLVFELGADASDVLILPAGSSLDISENAVLELLFTGDEPGTSYTLIQAEDGFGELANAEFWAGLLSGDSAANWHLAVVGNTLQALAGASDAVPEPSTWVLLLLGTFGLLYCRKK